jgi:hypothetical protein
MAKREDRFNLRYLSTAQHWKRKSAAVMREIDPPGKRQSPLSLRANLTNLGYILTVCAKYTETDAIGSSRTMRQLGKNTTLIALAMHVH